MLAHTVILDYSRVHPKSEVTSKYGAGSNEGLSGHKSQHFFPLALPEVTAIATQYLLW
jgi:hypothetical protein